MKTACNDAVKCVLDLIDKMSPEQFEALCKEFTEEKEDRPLAQALEDEGYAFIESRGFTPGLLGCNFVLIYIGGSDQ